MLSASPDTYNYLLTILAIGALESSDSEMRSIFYLALAILLTTVPGLPNLIAES